MDDENVNRKHVFWKFEIGSSPPKWETKNENRKQFVVFPFPFGTVQIENENTKLGGNVNLKNGLKS